MTKEQYIIFLTHIYTRSNGKHLSPASVNHYGEVALSKINQFIHKINSSYDTIFDIASFSQLQTIYQTILLDPEFQDLDKRGNRMYSAGLNRYMEFANGAQFVQKASSIPLLDTKEPVKYTTSVLEQHVPTRDRIKIIQLELASNYTCQIDLNHKSFLVPTPQKHPYMEGHHIIPLSQQADFQYSLDCYANIIVLCPTCHRFMHYGLDYEVKEKLITIYEDRAQRLFNCGIELDRQEFIERAQTLPRHPLHL